MITGIKRIYAVTMDKYIQMINGIYINDIISGLCSKYHNTFIFHVKFDLLL